MEDSPEELTASFYAAEFGRMALYGVFGALMALVWEQMLAGGAVMVVAIAVMVTAYFVMRVAVLWDAPAMRRLAEAKNASGISIIEATLLIPVIILLTFTLDLDTKAQMWFVTIPSFILLGLGIFFPTILSSRAESLGDRESPAAVAWIVEGGSLILESGVLFFSFYLLDLIRGEQLQQNSSILLMVPLFVFPGILIFYGPQVYFRNRVLGEQHYTGLELAVQFVALYTFAVTGSVPVDI